VKIKHKIRNRGHRIAQAFYGELMDKQNKDHNGHETIDFIGQLTEVERTYFLTFGTLKGYDKKDLSWMRYVPKSKRPTATSLENKDLIKGEI